MIIRPANIFLFWITSCYYCCCCCLFVIGPSLGFILPTASSYIITRTGTDAAVQSRGGGGGGEDYRRIIIQHVLLHMSKNQNQNQNTYNDSGPEEDEKEASASSSNQKPSRLSSSSRPPSSSLFDSFATSSFYRTFLFTGALLSSPSVRDVLGYPGVFAIVTATFAVYFYDTKFNYLVDVVTPRRQAALQAIREYKTQQLGGFLGTGTGTGTVTGTGGGSLPDLLDAYETALREELETRVILRIPSPSSPPPTTAAALLLLWVIEMDASQEDRAAAPQLLGLEITDQYTLE